MIKGSVIINFNLSKNFSKGDVATIVAISENGTFSLCNKEGTVIEHFDISYRTGVDPLKAQRFEVVFSRSYIIENEQLIDTMAAGKAARALFASEFEFLDESEDNFSAKINFI